MELALLHHDGEGGGDFNSLANYSILGFTEDLLRYIINVGINIVLYVRNSTSMVRAKSCTGVGNVAVAGVSWPLSSRTSVSAAFSSGVLLKGRVLVVPWGTAEHVNRTEFGAGALVWPLVQCFPNTSGRILLKLLPPTMF